MIQAIPTQYAGHKFRSRLEARWALFFDLLGIPWEYEREAFALTVDGKPAGFTPDFWLPDQGIWFEVKPETGAFDEDTLLAVAKKFKAFIEASGSAIHVAFGTPRDAWIMRHEPDVLLSEGYVVTWARCRKCLAFGLHDDERLTALDCGHWEGRIGHMMVEGALNDATSHRFWEPKARAVRDGE